MKTSNPSRRGFLGGFTGLLTFGMFEQSVLEESKLVDPTSLETKTPAVVWTLYRNQWDDYNCIAEDGSVLATYATEKAAKLAEDQEIIDTMRRGTTGFDEFIPKGGAITEDYLR